jgi:GNAT superfamily N-acetyltransferase
MEIIHTNGTDPQFAELVRELDDYLSSLIGREKQKSKYDRYNTLEDIKDVVLILDGDKAAACGGIKRYDDTTAELKRVYTKEAYRRQGCGRLLMKALEDRAAGLGYKRLILETGRIMTSAVGFYENLGYKYIPNYGQYADIPESVCMEKTLII